MLAFPKFYVILKHQSKENITKQLKNIALWEAKNFRKTL